VGSIPIARSTPDSSRLLNWKQKGQPERVGLFAVNLWSLVDRVRSRAVKHNAADTRIVSA
jgi:hypothetical protein